MRWGLTPGRASDPLDSLAGWKPAGPFTKPRPLSREWPWGARQRRKESPNCPSSQPLSLPGCTANASHLRGGPVQAPQHSGHLTVRRPLQGWAGIWRECLWGGRGPLRNSGAGLERAGSAPGAISGTRRPLPPIFPRSVLHREGGVVSAPWVCPAHPGLPAPPFGAQHSLSSPRPPASDRGAVRQGPRGGRRSQ